MSTVIVKQKISRENTVNRVKILKIFLPHCQANRPQTFSVLPRIYDISQLLFITEKTSSSFVEMSFQETTASGAALVTQITGKLVPVLYNASSTNQIDAVFLVGHIFCTG